MKKFAICLTVFLSLLASQAHAKPNPSKGSTLAQSSAQSTPLFSQFLKSLINLGPGVGGDPSFGPGVGGDPAFGPGVGGDPAFGPGVGGDPS